MPLELPTDLLPPRVEPPMSETVAAVTEDKGTGNTRAADERTLHWGVVRIVASYALVSALWIAFSDYALARLPASAETLTQLATLKGWLFVGLTSCGLYLMLWREVRRSSATAETKLKTRRALRQWADAFANCAHGLAISDPRSNLTMACNPAFARMLGRSVGELLDQPILERYQHAERDKVSAHVIEADRVGHCCYETVMVRKDGTAFDVQMDVVSVRDAAGHLLYRVATMQDITERKRAEHAWRESKTSMIEAQQVGAFGSWELVLGDLQRLEQNTLEWTDQCYRIFGYKPKEVPVTVAFFLEHVHADDRMKVRQAAADAVLKQRRYRIEHRVVRRDGEVRHVLAAGEVFVDRITARPVKLVGTMHDVTERVRAEAALRESEERFRAVVENIREVFWMKDVEQHRVLYVSPNYAQVWGRSCEELMHKPLAWLEALHPDDRGRVELAMHTKTLAGTFDEEFRIVQGDGTVRWVRDRAFPVKNAKGEIERIVGVAEDITDRKSLEAQFLRAQRMEAIGTLAGGIAHDLNNILAPMLMAAGLLKQNVTDEHARKMLSMVETSARRGAEIIRQLLTFSRGESGERVAIEVRHLLKEMGSIIRETFPREIELVENLPRTLWPVVADATQLHQVLVNLTVNARDAMPRGGRLSLLAENVTLTENDRSIDGRAKAGNYLVLSVADTGTGIPAEIIERIFDPFFTTKTLEKGTGLGLSTVLGIVRSHGGFLKVESVVGRGSTFRVYLPAAKSEAAENRPATTTPFAMGRGELILVVDDEEPIREATRHVLESHNYRVLTARNGKEAISCFLQQRENVRLVLTDVMMPEMGGAALIRALRVLSPKLHVIATSGLEPGREELESQSVTSILPKPCGPTLLLEAVRRELAQVT